MIYELWFETRPDRTESFLVDLSDSQDERLRTALRRMIHDEIIVRFQLEPFQPLRYREFVDTIIVGHLGAQDPDKER